MWRALTDRLALTLMIAIALGPALPSLGQGQREIDLIADLGQEVIAQREAAAAAALEAEHRARLEEQSRLREAYQQYLRGARQTAQQMIERQRRGVEQEQVDALRRQARIIIEDRGLTAQRIRAELDPIYAQLAEAIAVTPADLLAAEPRLAENRQRIGRQHDLDWVDRVAIMYALCENTDDAEVIAGNVRFREDQLATDEADAIDACNFRRLVLGLHPLAIDMQLVHASRDHSKDMIEHGFFAHTSPLEGKTSPWDRAENFQTTANAENIAQGYSSGDAVNTAWWYSPGHLVNLMTRGSSRIGVGQEQRTFTQMFGR